MAEPTRRAGKSRTTATAIGFVVVTVVFFVLFMFGFGFGPFATPTGEEAAEEAPTTDQPVEAFEAEENIEDAEVTPAPADIAPGTERDVGVATED